ncbi:MAG: hypothetical protein A2075_09260 [Geobacteraceae bacterium GWC2_58_44]|nr:MAG: hypothetical protein A2075_09260 [Geobacteraceae bacterium GWC2_58_44]HBG07701.1 hypothetical protein [Geobacter sp.]
METMFTEELRQSVEAASGGKQTVLRTDKGQATYMNIIPKFRMEDIHPTLGTGVHPAFLVGGVEKDEILIGTYLAVIRDGEALSLPGQDPATSINFDVAHALCLAAGEGFHLTTNWEWAAIALQVAAKGHDVRGNTSYGKSHSHPDERGTKVNGSNRTLTGSGPATWRHDGTEHGIADMVGNIWEWVGGLKLVGGRFVMPADNDFVLPEAQWPASEVCLEGINGTPRFSASTSCRGWFNQTFKGLAGVDGHPSADSLKQAMLCPLAAMDIPGHFWADTSEGFEALPFRGGSWDSGSNAGLAALDLDGGRSDACSALGFRPAFIR